MKQVKPSDYEFKKLTGKQVDNINFDALCDGAVQSEFVNKNKQTAIFYGLVRDKNIDAVIMIDQPSPNMSDALKRDLKKQGLQPENAIEIVAFCVAPAARKGNLGRHLMHEALKKTQAHTIYLFQSESEIEADQWQFHPGASRLYSKVFGSGEKSIYEQDMMFFAAPRTEVMQNLRTLLSLNTAAKKSAKSRTKVSQAVAAKSTLQKRKRSSGQTGCRVPQKARKDTFQTYTYKVLRQNEPDNGISQSGMCSIETLIDELLGKLLKESKRLLLRTGKKTLTAKEVQTATRLLLRGELAKTAVAQAEQALTQYNVAGTGQTRSNRAKLLFPVGRVERLVRQQQTANRISDSAPVYLAAILQYVVAEILQGAAMSARKRKFKRITPRDIMLTVEMDDELNKLFSGVFAHSGNVYQIEPALLPASKKTKLAK